MQKLTIQSDKFEIPESIHYLNGSFMSPQLKSVTAVGLANVGGKALPFNTTVDDFFEGTEKIRIEYSKLINNNQPNRVTLMPSVSYGIANITKNINLAGKEVVIVGEQFPSNVYPWMAAAKEQGGKVVTVAAPESSDKRGEKWNTKILEAINSSTAVVAIGQAHWADGTLFDLMRLRERTNDVGALLIIDGTQSVGAYPFDVEQIKPDALICAGYKWLLGPYGLGVAYYGEYFDDAKPIEENWINRLNSEDFSGLIDYEEAYQPGALRFEVGEHSSFILVPMLYRALLQLNEWQPQRIQDYCKEITEGPIKNLVDGGFWVEDGDSRTSHLFGIRHDNMPIEKIKDALAQRNVHVSYRGSAIRVSPYVHNSIENMKTLVDTLIECLN